MTVRVEPERAGSVEILPVRVESTWTDGPFTYHGTRDIRRLKAKPSLNVWYFREAEYRQDLITRGPDGDDRRQRLIYLSDGDEFVYSQNGVTDTEPDYHYIIESVSLVATFRPGGTGMPACNADGSILHGSDGGVLYHG